MMPEVFIPYQPQLSEYMSSRWSQIYADTVFYPTLIWNMILGRVFKLRNWWDAVDENVILGAYPFRSDVRKLSELGVGAVVNTCAEYEGPVAQYRQFGIEQLRVPTIDFTHPTLESLVRATDFMSLQIEQGKKVYVHCKAGRARSATVVAAWLIRNANMTADEAQELMLKVRSHINPRIAERPVVKEFESRFLN